MDIAQDLLASLTSRVAPPRAEADSGRIAWPELHARFSAAHAVVAELAAGAGADPVFAGGFANWKAGNNAGGNTSRAVNPTDLADGKCAAGIEGFTAGDAIAGGRGQ